LRERRVMRMHGLTTFGGRAYGIHKQDNKGEIA